MDLYDLYLTKKLNGGDIDSNAVLKSFVEGNLREVTADMLDGVTEISVYVFYNYSPLISITIPASVTSIGDYAFSSCSKLASVTMLRTTPPTLGGTSVFSSTSSALVIYVPAESVNAYKAKSRWSNYASRIQAIPS